MKTLTFDTREEWLEGRKGRITGSKMKDILSKRNTDIKKKGFYQLIADRIATDANGERPIDRGVACEAEALERFAKETGKKVDTSLVMWVSEDNENIAYSPDGFVKGKKIKEAIETKCLDSANHIEAYLTKTIPSEFEEQKIQAFVVNPDLQTLYFVFYDSRVLCKDYFVIECHRDELQDKIDEFVQYEKNVLEEVDRIVQELTF